MMQADKAAACHGLRIELGGRVVLEHVSFAIEQGEFVGLLGPNGAGKTSLLRVMLGLLAPAAGQVEILGGSPAARRSAIGYVPQIRTNPAGLSLSARDFVAAAAGGSRWGLPILSKSDRADVEQALDLVGGAALADRPLGSLSGGERQRLLLAQALLGRPRLLLLDEPLVNLDPHRQRDVVELVQKLQRQYKLAVLFSAHDLNPLLGAMDRVLYLGGGQAVIGNVGEVINGPVLTRLYGSPIEVMHAGARIFVVPGAQP
ncbi:MAG: ABC transporter ATP-binding protein [Rhodospirillales bacterium 20-60-12]|jgi:zinc/manganese transport system ATP-binding protein|nr:MAG: ABC transporter ATP-binding protein [Rhodospirillales bacterium 20-60-12]HQT66494.1 ATP-binding cassette domain-containing protein [Acetobacteraceae bacterium]HQU02338.1 ATP-binding cassette domain-containing protein [Acetobacteraceae bacterium]